MTDSADSVVILPVRGIGEITPGTDLEAAISAAAPWLRDGDILVVTSKIVSKAEGRLVEVPPSGPAREAARERILASETAQLVAERGHTRIVKTHHGFVMAAAGIDASNVERTRLVLLPLDPDASARSLRAAFQQRRGIDVAVIVSDTMGRPWRNGLTDVALGAAGIAPIRDHRGEIDPYGNELHITQMAVVDEIASAAELVKGKCDQVPVAVVRGLRTTAGADSGSAHGPGVRPLIRDAAHDLFSMGTAEARSAGLHDAATLADAPAFADHPGEPRIATGIDLVKAAIATVSAVSLLSVIDPPAEVALPKSTLYVVSCTVAVTSPDLAGSEVASLVAVGAELHRLRCALAAAGLASQWIPAPAGDRIGILAIGHPPTPT